MIQAVLLDIEGTICPVEFVTGALFPYARAKAGSFLAANWTQPEVRRIAGELRKQRPDLEDGPAALGEHVVSLIEADSKSTPLKELQGLIWHSAWTRGELKATFFPDVVPAFERWIAAGVTIAIYSSGSVAAQIDLFRSTTQGDLTRYVTAWFDTRMGSKRDRASYGRIASALRFHPDGILFVSDVVSELEAAAASGIRTLLALRPGNTPQEHERFAAIRSFDEVQLE